ncbi:GbsR/MarR family transcriptional regulator [Labilibaculum antarcticum]|uniref:Transcriptional regulator n=1 Tax=Labilibaculum antarcticum TaxID=1717717 RepID=A0A1Y1CPM4_9BACT|nr:transcriptional regulator [Labilibaculum antarcticum]BAX82220.1 transcriptional regulator [Labilibaculum antarcticum]
MMDLTQLEEQKKILVERFGMFMEKQENLAPIAARIFATLFMNKEKGITFDDLVHFLGASKSTISTNLQNLTKSNMIVYHTEPGDRKKYYSLSPVGFLARIEEKIADFKTEHLLVGQILDHKKLANEITKENEPQYIEDHETPYLDYLSNTVTILEQLRDEIKEKCPLTH